MNIGERLKYHLDRSNISGKKLAEAVNLHPSQISKIINNDSKPSIDALERICSALSITLAEFFLEDPTINDQIKQQVGDDLFPKLIEGIKKMDLPQEIKDKALSNFDSLSDKQKQDLLSQLVKSVRVEGNQINYSIDSDLTDVINKYKSLPAEHRKAVDLIIDSLHTKKGEHNERTN